MSKVREREKESVIQESDRVLILGWVGGGSEGAWLDHDRDVWSNGVWWVGGREIKGGSKNFATFR